MGVEVLVVSYVPEDGLSAVASAPVHRVGAYAPVATVTPRSALSVTVDVRSPRVHFVGLTTTDGRRLASAPFELVGKRDVVFVEPRTSRVVAGETKIDELVHATLGGTPNHGHRTACDALLGAADDGRST